MYSKYKVAGNEYNSSQHASPLRELTYTIWDHTVLPAARYRWHSTFTTAGTRFRDPREIARLTWPSWIHIHTWYTCLKTVTHPSTNRAQRSATWFVRRRRTTLPLRRTANRQRLSDMRSDELRWVIWTLLYTLLSPSGERGWNGRQTDRHKQVVASRVAFSQIYRRALLTRGAQYRAKSYL